MLCRFCALFHTKRSTLMLYGSVAGYITSSRNYVLIKGSLMITRGLGKRKGKYHIDLKRPASAVQFRPSAFPLQVANITIKPPKFVVRSLDFRQLFLLKSFQYCAWR